MDGHELIVAERERQVAVEGWTSAHDDTHAGGELMLAAACYEMPPTERVMGLTPPPGRWPWEPEWWKPTPDNRERELVKAGALYLAENERLRRSYRIEQRKYGGLDRERAVMLRNRLAESSDGIRRCAAEIDRLRLAAAPASAGADPK